MYEININILKLMIESIDKIFRYTNDLSNADEFEQDSESFDATLMNFITLGENISKLSDDFRDKHSQINWRKIYAFRNVIAHDYFGLLSKEVWEIVIKDLPKLKSDIEKIINIHSH